MHKCLIPLLVALILSFTQVARADEEQKPVVLSPGNLYEMIEQSKKSGTTKDLYLSGKINSTLELIDKLQRQQKELQFRVEELERKVAGVQNQVTVLHAKKADKIQLQKLERFNGIQGAYEPLKK